MEIKTNEQTLIIEDQAKRIEHLYEIIEVMRNEMENAQVKYYPSLPRGFARLSPRYEVFPFILGSGKSLKSLEKRPGWKWKWKSWFAWLAFQDIWELTLTDGRRFRLTDEEKETYMEQIRNHDEAVKWIKIVDQTRNAYKTGAGS